MTDKEILCKECGAPFVFTAGEQEFYKQKGFTNEPTRCRDCRQRRRQQQEGYPSAYGSVGYASTDGEARPQRERHTSICSSCGKEAITPFLPRADKPVYCSECFEVRRTGASSNARA